MSFQRSHFGSSLSLDQDFSANGSAVLRGHLDAIVKRAIPDEKDAHVTCLTRLTD